MRIGDHPPAAALFAFFALWHFEIIDAKDPIPGI